ncbi:cobalamin-binding protein [Bacteroides intestinalis]|jgi:corrinoid protein of di/trimethylamine methyltransferase|uniref:Cobalamin-binding protein n=2 Tax=Bacteroides intestinalis TaxID=329854 RepID=A0A414LC35_9BACE|nr:cobalamin-binding protein [Bacteroides intestinalis]
MMSNLNELYDAILVGKLEDAVKVTKIAVEEGVTPHEIINQYMIKAMEEIGSRFEAGKVFVPNLLMSARAMRGALDVLKPLMQGQVDSYIGKIVIGTVKGDLHDIGKNLVASMFEGCGFEVINLGVDVSSDKFISAALENKADIICMSALLTTTMNYMKEVVAAVEASELKGKVKIMVGGAPVNDAFAKAIGADAYTSNANAAVVMAKKLIAAN